MAMKNLILVMAVVFSVSLLAQETQEEKVKAVKEFCDGLDINGKVVNAERSDFIKKICSDKANAQNIMCRWYSINEDGVVTIAENKLDDVRLVCKQLLAKTKAEIQPDRTEKQEASFFTMFQRPIGGTR